MRDIVATIQAEQDEIIRLDHPEVLVIEGGPGTGKTVVALHRVILIRKSRFVGRRQHPAQRSGAGSNRPMVSLRRRVGG